jgi:hypothetical protein
VLYVEPRHVDSVEGCTFYHVMDLPGVGRVGGQWDLRGRFGDYTGHVAVAGRRVLDVGTASGFLTFEAERHGAKEVVSFDADSASRISLLPLKDHISFINRPAWVESYEPHMRAMHGGYWFAHRALGSKAKAVYGDVYQIPSEIGVFDVVIVGQILVHLSDPIRALSSVLLRCGDTLVITEGMLDDEKPIAGLCARAALKNNWSWWHLSIGLYREVLTMAGFDIERIGSGSYKLITPEGEGSVELKTIVARRGR